MKTKTAAFLIIYLGELPSYFDFWAKSCKKNYKQFHWFLYNDHIKKKIEVNEAVTLVPYNFKTLCNDLKKHFDICIPNENTRIVCDCRLMLYPIRRDEETLDQYDFIGYSDIDVIYGQIHKFIPDNALDFSMISAVNGRPCGPFTLFNRKFLINICKNKIIKERLEQNHGSVYASQQYADPTSKFKPISGNSIKDQIAKSINFEHLDESKALITISQKYAPVFCNADPLDPTGTRWFNHRKAVAFYENDHLYIRDNRGHKKEAAFFHFSRFKNRKRFKINHDVLHSTNWGIYKYGIISLRSIFTKIKMLFTLLY